MIILNCVDCLPAEQDKVAKAQIVANSTMQSQCFDSFMKDRGLVWTNNRTAEEVVQHLRTTTITAPVHYYSGYALSLTKFKYPKAVEIIYAPKSISPDGCDGVIGYRNIGALDIYFNRCYHSSYGVCSTASNASHEWSHDLGYDHAFNFTAERPYTVPYSINAAFSACCIEP